MWVINEGPWSLVNSFLKSSGSLSPGLLVILIPWPHCATFLCLLVSPSYSFSDLLISPGLMASCSCSCWYFWSPGYLIYCFSDLRSPRIPCVFGLLDYCPLSPWSNVPYSLLASLVFILPWLQISLVFFFHDLLVPWFSRVSKTKCFFGMVVSIIFLSPGHNVHLLLPGSPVLLPSPRALLTSSAVLLSVSPFLLSGSSVLLPSSEFCYPPPWFSCPSSWSSFPSSWIIP